MTVAWYVATTYYAEEVIAARGLNQQGLKTFNPRCRVPRTVRGNLVLVERSYLPGYIFVEFDPSEQTWRFINSTRGVKALLSSDPETPNRLRAGVVDSIMNKCSEDGFVSEPEVDRVLARFFPSGSAVRVTSGPLASKVGLVEWSHADRVKVIFDLFGRKTKAEVACSNLELTC